MGRRPLFLEAGGTGNGRGGKVAGVGVGVFGTAGGRRGIVSRDYIGAGMRNFKTVGPRDCSSLFKTASSELPDLATRPYDRPESRPCGFHTSAGAAQSAVKSAAGKPWADKRDLYNVRGSC